MRHFLIRHVVLAAALVAAGAASSAARAGLLETLSNDLGPDWEHWWADAINWNGITPYSAETGAELTAGIAQVTVCHDDEYLYILVDQASQTPFASGNQVMFFDADVNLATGTKTNLVSNKPIAVGAEYTLNGGALVPAVGPSSTIDEWTYVNPSHANGNFDYILQLDRAKLGEPTAFNWSMTMIGGGDDDYPNFENYYRYSFAPIPRAGDFNGDGAVTGLDLTAPSLGWKARFGADLGGDDFLVWQRHLGAGPASAAIAAIAEPSTAALGLLAGLGALRSVRRRGNVA